MNSPALLQQLRPHLPWLAAAVAALVVLLAELVLADKPAPALAGGFASHALIAIVAVLAPLLLARTIGRLLPAEPAERDVD
ncbi:hypothetical protein J2T55_000935 [Methylohalomonas lacus]|uniref:Uncharacterized protein n=1 Tax=Methylohalomonas lacus TaxID=398773 RepID=A0AAE3HM05_9GAMM|nr:hypothetical protein [Methylohalomonas lacus]MCS3902927.1 hypothetical protein [Methylohalomonas lacus]